MLIDALSLDSGISLEESIVIVGAGAAGITIACEFEKIGLNAILIESGDFNPDSETQNLYKGFVDSTSPNSLPHEPIDKYRARFFGGTTNWWGGACLPYDEIDFLKKTVTSNSGWPISRESLDQYYSRANEYFGINLVDFNLPPKSKLGSREVIDGLSSSSIFKTKYWLLKENKVNFGKKYKNKLKNSKNIKILLNANVISLEQKNESIEHLIVKTINNKKFTVRGKKIILAMGGLEIPRILLASKSHSRNGVGNNFDLVGRFYSPHVNATHGILILNPKVKVDRKYEKLSKGILYRKFISLSDDYIKKGYMNCKILLESIDTVEKNELTEHVYKLFHPMTGINEIYNKILDKKNFAFALNGAFDQVPNYDSGIKLSKEKDVLGTPKIILKHAITEQDKKAYSDFYKLLAITVGSYGLGRFCYDKSMRYLFKYIEGYHGASHHTGMTRMAIKPSEGVVDVNCKVFGLSNLYISSASIFPTASHANPTYTIVALSIRLAEHLGNEMRSG